MRILLTPICWLREFWLTILHGVSIDGHSWQDMEYKETKTGGKITSQCTVCGKMEYSFITGKSRWDDFISSHGK